MNIFEYENSVFGNDLWTKKSIADVRKLKPRISSNTDIFPADELAEEKYREYQEQNFNEYFTGSYKYRLWR